jgi:NTP pyrophosphatase (non-canonical NTP hydrolase)
MNLNEARDRAYAIAKSKEFWSEPYNIDEPVFHWGELVDRENVENPLAIPTKLMLINSECCEALKVHRDRPEYEDEDLWFAELQKELIDIGIRWLDLCGYLGIDVDHVMSQKMDYNESRPTRHGKAY